MAFDREISGLDQPEIEARLGPPVVEKAQGIGKALEYRERNCSIELTFYPEVETRVYRALAYQVKSDDDTNRGKRACLEHFATLIHAK